ncbi:PilZ domain-containing protein [Edaphobacter modestus]|uniref:PilZ domain-containing protein n=1 Tax=Edaphobacter modestus TaxID=388466 RepID=A0A4Q7Z072_9BACT|nr:PilZ domain-containing protein [Edaphobacter modestus]RZU43488.1 PilZ domain-containing protein [Edaphobacter modestus]
MGHWMKLKEENPVRTAVRFPMKLPLQIQTSRGEFDAVTENISANGLLFISDHLPEVNSRIEFTISMPSAVMGSATDVKIHCVGRVVRSFQQDGVKKAAAVIDEYFLRA